MSIQTPPSYSPPPSPSSPPSYIVQNSHNVWVENRSINAPPSSYLKKGYFRKNCLAKSLIILAIVLAAIAFVVRFTHDNPSRTEPTLSTKLFICAGIVLLGGIAQFSIKKCIKTQEIIYSKTPYAIQLLQEGTIDI